MQWDVHCWRGIGHQERGGRAVMAKLLQVEVRLGYGNGDPSCVCSNVMRKSLIDYRVMDRTVGGFFAFSLVVEVKANLRLLLISGDEIILE